MYQTTPRALDTTPRSFLWCSRRLGRPALQRAFGPAWLFPPGTVWQGNDLPDGSDLFEVLAGTVSSQKREHHGPLVA